jgi:opacity protein-like surface antigen
MESFMTGRQARSSIKTTFAVSVTLALLAGATTAEAQYREDRWEFSLGTFYQLGTTIDGQEGAGLDTGNEFGLVIGGGFNFTDKLATTFDLKWAGVGYDATAMDEDSAPVDISGKYDSFTVSGNLVYYFSDTSQLSPYIGAGIGWTWIDTNVPNGPPYTWCWWDPWLGYVCSTNYPTETLNAFSYQATLGLRYEFDNDQTFMRLGYTSLWMDFDASSGTPRFDVFVLDIGWMF